MTEVNFRASDSQDCSFKLNAQLIDWIYFTCKCLVFLLHDSTVGHLLDLNLQANLKQFHRRLLQTQEVLHIRTYHLVQNVFKKTSQLFASWGNSLKVPRDFWKNLWAKNPHSLLQVRQAKRIRILTLQSEELHDYPKLTSTVRSACLKMITPSSVTISLTWIIIGSETCFGARPGTGLATGRGFEGSA